ncbi:DNA cytosine methyltransferase [Shewanella sp. 3B26]|uniref:DNA (cytosine-5-)-methyltransferase n=1 Tax=Shewanella zhuhaiensis TaxID=2919576 RepID=A0AAJ1BGC5_9GAMM|nr:DNA cytosine methyltransferase [Shewanella zhuhaiensis]MCH4294193.1 DNA cytosine methyltransferase [Shewanella zhuhaiensis]
MGIYRGLTQFAFNLDEQELIIDNFAGGGGASTGIELAIGRPVDEAINHDPAAIAMHKTNHPLTRHHCESVWDVDPVKLCAGRPVGLAWFSPDCKHFSKAKGGKPVEKKIRGLAWVAVRYAATVKPRIIMLENVEEFKTWGPVVNGQPCQQRKGQTFDGFVRALSTGLGKEHQAWKDVYQSMLRCNYDLRQKLETYKTLKNGCGYKVEWRELRACDFGAPTIRKRFFLIARCDCQPIIWPAATHGNPANPQTKEQGLKPWRTAADCIDWSIPCPSIFERKKPLAEKTMARIAKGIQRFVIDASEPFIVTCNHSGDSFRGQGLKEPMKTICASRDAHGLVTPVLAPLITEHANASSQRNMPAGEPLRTICAEVKGGHFALVSALLAKHYGGNYTGAGAELTDPMHTVTTVDHHALVTAQLSKFHGKDSGAEPDTPLPTVLTKSKQALVSSSLIKLRGTCKDGQPVTEPMPTITAGGTHVGEVRAFLLKYYGTNIGHAADEPLQTITTKHRFGLVMVRGEPYQIVDIGMRMLEPHELFAAQGFPADYIIDVDYTGTRYSKAKQVARCGNSVPPDLAAALVRANFVEQPAICRVA